MRKTNKQTLIQAKLNAKTIANAYKPIINGIGHCFFLAKFESAFIISNFLQLNRKQKQQSNRAIKN